MALNYQAFIDDSSGPSGEFVLAGYIATAETWEKFSKEWEELLPSGTLAKNDKYHFKMSEMAMVSERMKRVPAFYWIIEKYDLLPISCRINLRDFERALQRVKTMFLTHFNKTVHFGVQKNPYVFTFSMLLDNFHYRRNEFADAIPLTEKVDFIFDNQSDKTLILGAWDSYLAVQQDEIQPYYGATPQFEDDQEFLPLQAADFWAWWVREWYEEDEFHPPAKLARLDFGKWKGTPRRMLVQTFFEDDIVDALQGMAMESMVHGKNE